MRFGSDRRNNTVLEAGDRLNYLAYLFSNRNVFLSNLDLKVGLDIHVQSILGNRTYLPV
jgi:hypothetical protein